MTLGESIIEELGRRQMHGVFLDYQGYARLRQIDSRRDVVQFFSDHDIRISSEGSQPAEIVDCLRDVFRKRVEQRARPFRILGVTLSVFDILFLIAMAGCLFVHLFGG